MDQTPPRNWQQEADTYAAEALKAEDPTGWFERLYAAGADGSVTMPWDHDGPQYLLGEWTRSLGSQRGRAVVIGCGLGADAEHLSALGFETTAFDISPTAVRTATERNPGSAVRYQVADLFDPPEDWAFDLVVEIYTVQALPHDLRERATAAVGRLVAPGGTLLVIQAVLDPDEQVQGPPWPLTREEIDAFAADGLVEVRVENIPDREDPSFSRWRAEFRRG